MKASFKATTVESSKSFTLSPNNQIDTLEAI